MIEISILLCVIVSKPYSTWAIYSFNFQPFVHLIALMHTLCCLVAFCKND